MLYHWATQEHTGFNNAYMKNFRFEVVLSFQLNFFFGGGGGGGSFLELDF